MGRGYRTSTSHKNCHSRPGSRQKSLLRISGVGMGVKILPSHEVLDAGCPPSHLRYFRKPYGAAWALTHRVPTHPPAAQKTPQRNPNLQESPRVNRITPEAIVISPKVNVISPKVNVKYFRAFWKKSIRIFEIFCWGVTVRGASKISKLHHIIITSPKFSGAFRHVVEMHRVCFLSLPLFCKKSSLMQEALGPNRIGLTVP